MYVLNRKKQSSRVFILGILIAVASIHIAILASMDGFLSYKGTRSETVRLLESFVIEANEPTAVSPHNPIQTTSTSTRGPATEVSAPTDSVAQQKISSRSRTNNPSRNKPSTTRPNIDTQTNDRQDAFTPAMIHAEHVHNPPPPYPKRSRHLGEQGKVVIAVAIDIDGTSAEAVIHQSSGHHRLDRAALETVMKWRFIPAKKGGEYQKMWVNIPINFVLE